MISLNKLLFVIGWIIILTWTVILTENLVPCVFLELFFVMQLLTTRSVSGSETMEQDSSVCGGKTGLCASIIFSLVSSFCQHLCSSFLFSCPCHFKDALERPYLGNVHNCVYFAVRVLENQFPWVSLASIILSALLCVLTDCSFAYCLSGCCHTWIGAHCASWQRMKEWGLSLHPWGIVSCKLKTLVLPKYAIHLNAY